MNQIICDACGSKYPETDERCPVCGFARQGNEKVVAASAAEPVAVKAPVDRSRHRVWVSWVFASVYSNRMYSVSGPMTLVNTAFSRIQRSAPV